VEVENMQLAAPIQSSGFPQSYPYAQSMPLPSAILRPLQQPIYDTEILPAVTPPTEVIFFQRQLGQTTTAGALTKTAAETNLQQPGQLANPIEFSLFGFFFEVQPDIIISDFVDVYKQSVFTYSYTGNRVYLQIPLTRIPQGVAPEGFGSAFGAIHNGVGHISNMYKFTIGRSALRIRPTESFQAKVSWPSGPPGSVAPALTGSLSVGTTVGFLGIRLRTILGGLTWTAL
jgi:hypothetical protein